MSASGLAAREVALPTLSHLSHLPCPGRPARMHLCALTPSCLPPPGPPPRAQKMWRRPLIKATGVAAGSALVVKTDVKGGMPPSIECDASKDTDVLVVSWRSC